MFVDLADELDAGTFQQRLDFGAEIDLVGAVHLGGNLEWNAERAGDGDRAVRAFFRRDSSQEGDVVPSWRSRRRTQSGRQAVVDGGREVGIRNRKALRVGN